MPKIKKIKVQMRLPSNPPKRQKSKLAKQISADVIQKINKKQKPQRSLKLVNDFAHGLKHPFDPKTLGLQVPDPYSFPTTTYHSHTTSVLGVGNTAETVGAVVVFPNPLLSMVDISHLNNLISTDYAVQSTPLNRLNATVSVASNAFLGATTQNDLSSKFSTYRVTSWGFTLRNLIPQLSATGKIIIAPLPIGDTIPNYAQLIGMGNSGGFTSMMGIPALVIESSAILQLPGAFEISVGDLMRGDFEVSGMYTSSSFFDFKMTSNSGSPAANTSQGDSADFNSVTNIATNYGYKDPTRMVGGVAYAIFYEGLPQDQQNAFEIELIYHLEGSPQVSLSASSTLVPSSHALPTIGSTQDVEEAMKGVSTMDRVVKFIARGAEFLNRNQNEIAETVRSIRAATNYFFKG